MRKNPQRLALPRGHRTSQWKPFGRQPSAIATRYLNCYLHPLPKLLSEDHPSCVLIWFLTGTIRRMRSISNVEVFFGLVLILHRMKKEKNAYKLGHSDFL